MEIIPCMTVLLWMNLGGDSRTPSSPATPRLSLSPAHRIFVQGEEMTLKCSVPEGYQPQIFFFCCRNESGSSILEKTHLTNTWTISTAHLSARETQKLICTCMSKSRTRSKLSFSPLSKSREFLVVELPPAPSLSPDPPQPLYLVGENVTFWCSAPNITLQGWRRYQFSHLRDDEDKPSIKDVDWPEGNISLVLTATREDSGLYKCRYLVRRYGRDIPSEWSLPVSIVVRDPLPPPVLKLYLAAGSLEILSMLCLSSERNNNNTKRFHFSQDGVEMTSSQEEPVKSSRDFGVLTLNTSVAFLYPKDNESLRLACRYEEKISGRWIMSPWSQTLNVTAEPVWNEDFNFIWSYARMAILLIILLVPFAFYCWTKKSNVEITYSCTQDSFAPSSPEPTRTSHLTQEKTDEPLYHNLVR